MKSTTVRIIVLSLQTMEILDIISVQLVLMSLESSIQIIVEAKVLFLENGSVLFGNYLTVSRTLKGFRGMECQNFGGSIE
jgi:hypothetical protein